MIRRENIGFRDSDDGGDRRGSCVIFHDDANDETVIIDGYCGVGKTKLLKRAKARGYVRPWLYLTHAHGDHYDGIKALINSKWCKPKGFGCYDPDSIKEGANQNSEINSDRNALLSIVALCKKKGIPVTYLHSSDTKKHGDIRFKVFREQPHYLGKDEDPHGWCYLNDGSLIFWFYELKTLVVGDGPEKIGEFCKKRHLDVKDFQIPHHGGNCNKGRAAIMAETAFYCWDDNYCKINDDFVQYGRKRCLEAGIEPYGIRGGDVDGDINVIYFSKKAVIYTPDGRIRRYDCNYKGLPTLKSDEDHNAALIRKILRGKYSKGGERVTMLLNESYNPGIVQKKVNKTITLAADILAGRKNYGKDKARRDKIDAEMGTGFGQLVQDYINVLAGVKESV